MDITLARKELRIHLGVTDVDLPPEDADLLINRSVWQLTNMYPFKETEKTRLFSTVAGTRLYEVPVLFEAIRNLSIVDPTSLAHSPIHRMTPYDYESNFVETPEMQGKPTHYIREGDCIRLFPTPDQIYEMVLKHWITFEDLDDSHPDFPLPQNWFEIVILGATWRGFIRLRNPTMAADVKNQQVAIIRDTKPIEAKEETDTHMGAVKVEGYNPGNIYQDTGFGP